MLVPFVIDADSLTPDPSWSAAQALSYSYSLLNVWKKIGLLVYDGESLDESKIYQAVRNLPQKIRPLWIEMLNTAPQKSCTGWKGSVTRDKLSDFSEQARLALVDDARAELEFDIAEDSLDGSALADNGDLVVDICRLIASDKARQFITALKMADGHIEPGSTFQNTWDLRFKKFAFADIKRISIVDRYALSNHILHDQGQLSGLERFLRLLDEDAKGKRYITLFSANEKKLQARSIVNIKSNMQTLLNRLPEKNIKKIKVFLLPNYHFGKMSHDRFVRFGKYVWDLGVGLDVFDGGLSKTRSAATLKSWESVKSYENVENELSSIKTEKGRKFFEISCVY